MAETEDVVDSSGRLFNQQPAYYQIINSKVQFQHKDRISVDTVKRWSHVPDGVTAGTYDDKTILNLIIYEV